MTVEQFAAEFQRWRILSGFDQGALRYHFHDGLQTNIRLALAPEFQTIQDVDTLMRRAAEIDVNLRIANRQTFHSTTPKPTTSAPSAPTTSDPDAMDIGRMQIRDLQKKVPKEEWERRLRAFACLSCGRAGHCFYRCRSGFSPDAPPSPRSQKASVATMPAAPEIPAPAPAASSTPPAASQESINRMLALLEGWKSSSSFQSQPGF